MADSLSKRANALLEKTLSAMEARFNQEPCDHCGSMRISLKDVELMMKFLKDNGFMIQPEKPSDALDAIIKHLPGEGRPDVAPSPRYTN